MCTVLATKDSSMNTLLQIQRIATVFLTVRELENHSQNLPRTAHGASLCSGHCQVAGLCHRRAHAVRSDTCGAGSATRALQTFWHGSPLRTFASGPTEVVGVTGIPSRPPPDPPTSFLPLTHSLALGPGGEDLSPLPPSFK